MKHALFFLLCTTAYGLEDGLGYFAGQEQLFLANVSGEILSSDFEKFPTAKSLTLAWSKIYRIEDGAFCGAPFVRIALVENYLPHLTGRMFRNCSKLKELKIAGNRHLTANADIFRNLMHLEQLEIGQPITKLTKQHLRGLTSLKSLTISNAYLEKIEPGAFDDLVNLERLWFTNNKFRDAEEVLSKLKQLKRKKMVTTYSSQGLDELPLMQLGKSDTLWVNVN